MAPSSSLDYQGPIYSATYSNVPVFEYNIDGNHVMRRQHDGWINATHILKVAGHDKPARTRVLEREVQKGVHQKVQGGYGKYQGTWIPLESGQDLAKKNNVYEKLRPIFDFVPGPVTPPPAPKHTTAASNKPKVPRAPAVRRNAKPKPVPNPRQVNDDDYDNISETLNDDVTPDNTTVVSENTSMLDEEDFQRNQLSGNRKRKRVDEQVNGWSKADEEHRIYADALLDYFMLHDGDSSYVNLNPPVPPSTFRVDRAIDTQGHSALHWAAAMGEIEIVKDLMRRGANIEVRNIRGETPLIRAGLFANAYERGTMEKIVDLLQDTIMIPDSYGGTVFHHVAHTANSGSKAKRARTYLTILINKLREITLPAQASACLNAQDRSGETAFHIATRNSKKCMRVFQGAGCASDIPNKHGETVDQYLQRTATVRRRTDQFPLSSSPTQPDSQPNGREIDMKGSVFPFQSDGFHTEAARSFSESFGLINEKAFGVMQAGEAEILEKNSALTDANRLMEITTKDLNATRQKIFELESQIEDTDLVPLRKEQEKLIAENEAIQEQKQHRTLHNLVRAEEDKAVKQNHSNGTMTEDEIAARVQAAVRLNDVQIERRELTRAIVRSQADEGMTVRGEQYIKLLCSSLEVTEETLPDMVDEILEELELSKHEGGDDMIE